ncbi:hypothetical protein ACIPPQ_20280 [Sphingopyxis sp. LARHCG72]
MSDAQTIGQDCVDQQAELFRLAESRYGLTIALIAQRTKLSTSTLKSWRRGVAMPAWALFALKQAGVPDELLSLVSLPFGCSVTSRGEIDIEELCEIAAELDQMYTDARRPHSEAGIHLGHTESARLAEIAGKLRARAGVAD